MKKKVLLVAAALTLCAVVQAQDGKERAADSTHIPSLDEIIEMESNLSLQKESENHYKSIWGKATYLNLNVTNSTTLSSLDLPTDGGTYQREFKNKMGIGIQMGHTYDFHKKPIGTVLFIGLDYTPLDLNFNTFEEEEPSPEYNQGTNEPYCLPWHQKKMTIDYGMALGPSLTFYPFTALHRSGTDPLRLQVYFHVGYHIGLGIIEDVKIFASQNKQPENEMLWANGLSTSFGVNLTWNFVGLGYERRHFSNFTYHPINTSFKSGDVECKQTNNRFYIQFRF